MTHCDETKVYITERKAEMRKKIQQLKKAGLDAEYVCMDSRLREVEAVEAKLYGGLAFVPNDEDEPAEKLIKKEKATEGATEIPVE
jgi:hypothetical protein